MSAGVYMLQGRAYRPSDPAMRKMRQQRAVKDTAHQPLRRTSAFLSASSNVGGTLGLIFTDDSRTATTSIDGTETSRRDFNRTSDLVSSDSTEHRNAIILTTDTPYKRLDSMRAASRSGSRDAAFRHFRSAEPHCVFLLF